jgi:adenine-specific DNA-methyltransferase
LDQARRGRSQATAEEIIIIPQGRKPIGRFSVDDSPAPGNPFAVKKAFGVYYTPAYIVDYIVANTVGALCAGKSPAQVAKLRILDPTCGCGAFLLGAYQHLLDWHRDWYVHQSPAKYQTEIAKDRAGDWRLTSAAKRRILRSNIYGVDIDEQAVEASKLALQEAMLNDRAQNDCTPTRSASVDLGHNLQCGNSILGPDFFDRLARSGCPQTSLDHLRLLNWQSAFPVIMSEGGFDAVIGNPPYGAALTHAERGYLAHKFSAGTTDPAALMMLQAHRLTKPGGWNGFIVPKSFAYSSNWKIVRDCLLADLSALIDVGKVWKDVKLEQIIYLLQKDRPTISYASLYRSGKAFLSLTDLPKDVCREFGFLVNGLRPTELAVARKLLRGGNFLGDFTTNARGAMLQGILAQDGNGRRVIGGKQVQPYRLAGAKGRLAEGIDVPVQASVRPGSILVQNIVAHVAHPHEHIKIIGVVVTRKKAREIAILDTVNQLVNHSPMSSYYLLGLLHSRLLNWYVYRFVFARAIRTMHFDGPVTMRIPVRRLDVSRTADKARHDRITAQVKKLIVLHEKLAAGPSVAMQEAIRCQIAVEEQRLNRLVYKLHGLSGAEIDLVEE